MQGDPHPVKVRKLAVVIPALNEATSISRVIADTKTALCDIDHEIIIVDGQSSDGTDKLAVASGARVIYQPGKGYGDALRTGFAYARKRTGADVIVMQDADLTYDPKDALELLRPIMEGRAEMVVGNRFERMERGAMTRVNLFGNKLLSSIARFALDLRIGDTQCGMRAFKADLLRFMTLQTEGMTTAIEMLSEAKFAGATITEVPISYRVREGRTKLHPLKDGLRILGTMLRLMRDSKPLIFFGGLGLLSTLGGIVLGLDIVLIWLSTGAITRLGSLILSVLLLVAGLQLFAFGLLADMIRGMRRESKRIE